MQQLLPHFAVKQLTGPRQKASMANGVNQAPCVFVYCEKTGDEWASMSHKFVLRPETMAHGQTVTMVSPELAETSGALSALYSKLEEMYEYCEIYVPLDALNPAFSELKDRILKGHNVAGSAVAAVNAKVNYTHCGRIRVYPIDKAAFNANLYAEAVYRTRTREYSAPDMQATNGTPLFVPVWRDEHREKMRELGKGKRAYHPPHSRSDRPTSKPRPPRYWNPRSANPSPSASLGSQNPTEPFQQLTNQLGLSPSPTVQPQALQEASPSAKSYASAVSPASTITAWGANTPQSVRGISSMASWSSVARGKAGAVTPAEGAADATEPRQKY